LITLPSIATAAPLSYQLLAGLTEPPVLLFIVRKYWVVKFAVYVVLVVGATV
jgi:hypothetical protein